MQAMGMPARSLNWATLFLALRTTAFWPAMAVSSSTATSSTLMFWMASPTPMLMTIFCRRGTCMAEEKANSSLSFDTTSWW